MNPPTPTPSSTASVSRRLTVDGGAGSRSAAFSGSAARPASTAVSPTARFAAAAIRLVAWMPNCSMKKKPVARSPATAPRVFTPYKRLIPAPNRRSCLTRPWAMAGSEPPMQTVGTTRINSANTKRVEVMITGDSSPWAKAPR